MVPITVGTQWTDSDIQEPTIGSSLRLAGSPNLTLDVRQEERTNRRSPCASSQMNRR
jgi:hypothetical protein